ncbi:hypothetical protein Q7P37_007145 [Cladosporium fusiforme]
MGWFWGNSDASGSSASNTNDPYSKLDPALREFLEKESPLKYKDTQAQAQAAQQKQQQNNEPDYRAQVGLDKPGLTQENQNAAPRAPKTSVPPESLYQDGRYADLWKTYRPEAEIQTASKSDQDRMRDVFDAYSERKAAIGRAAIENCVMEQIAEKDCFTHGSWMSRMTMCREENRNFLRCYEMQSRFLKALGYLSQPRSGDEEERIQMHADKLYGQMLEREAAAAAAKEAGEEAPVQAPLINAEATTKALGADSAWSRVRKRAAEQNISTALSSYAPEKQEAIRERIKDMEPQQKELELQLIAAEARAQLEYADQIKSAMDKDKEERASRRDRGRETMGDKLKNAWGWDR